MSKTTIIIIAVVFVVAVAGASVCVYFNQDLISRLLGKEMPAQTAAENTVKYINGNLLAQGNSASLVSVSSERGVYKLTLDIGGQQFDSYVTKDGVLLFPEGYEMKKVEQATSSSPEVQKSDKPNVKLFVMSYCPYGLQAEKMFLPVYNLLKDKVDMGIYFVDYAMHEKKELDENLIQYCTQQEESAKYEQYLSCFVISGDSASCLASTGVDTVKINSCVSQTDSQFKVTALYNDKSSWLSGQYPPFNVEADLNKQYSISGSPTIVINDKVVDVSPRTPENFKEIICNSFNSQPAECSQTLSSDTPSPGFGGGTGTSTNSTCG